MVVRERFLAHGWWCFFCRPPPHPRLPNNRLETQLKQRRGRHSLISLHESKQIIILENVRAEKWMWFEVKFSMSARQMRILARATNFHFNPGSTDTQDSIFSAQKK